MKQLKKKKLVKNSMRIILRDWKNDSIGVAMVRLIWGAIEDAKSREKQIVKFKIYTKLSESIIIIWEEYE